MQKPSNLKTVCAWCCDQQKRILFTFDPLLVKELVAVAECRKADLGDIQTSEAHSLPTYHLAQRKCTLCHFFFPFCI